MNKLLLCLSLCLSLVHSFPEKGRWTFDIDENKLFVGVSKSLFPNTSISLQSNLLLYQLLYGQAYLYSFFIFYFSPEL